MPLFQVGIKPRPQPKHVVGALVAAIEINEVGIRCRRYDSPISKHVIDRNCAIETRVIVKCAYACTLIVATVYDDICRRPFLHHNVRRIGDGVYRDGFRISTSIVLIRDCRCARCNRREYTRATTDRGYSRITATPSTAARVHGERGSAAAIEVISRALDRICATRSSERGGGESQQTCQ